MPNVLLVRAERALDLKEIERLQRAYGYYIDHSDWDNVVDLLTEDATAEYGQSGIYVGKASIRALLYGIGYGQRGLLPQQLREHTQLQPVVTLSPDGRTAQGALARDRAAGPVQPVRRAGRSAPTRTNTARKTAAGRSRACTGTKPSPCLSRVAGRGAWR